jgi:hypothetical protein
VSDISKVISRLEQQRASIDRAISALREVEVTGTSAPVAIVKSAAAPAPAAAGSAPKKKNRLSAAGRRRIAEAAKRYWAQKRAEKGVVVAKKSK